MLELVLMIVFCGKLREVLGEKRRSPIPYQIALVGLWMFVQPVWLGIVCAALFFTLGSAAENLILFAYGASLIGATSSALVVFLVATLTPPARSLSTAAREN